MDPPTNTRSPGLLQPDIFYSVLDALAAPTAPLERVKRKRPVLFALARTCRAFLEPSLDRLWSKLDSLEPLVRCYSAVFNDEETVAVPPSSTEWIAFRRHSHRIRELRIGPLGQTIISFLKSAILQPSLLAPNLRSLSWYPCALELESQPSFFAVFARRLFSPSLVSLVVSLSNPDYTILQSFLSDAALICLDLKRVTIKVAEREDMSQMTIGTLSQAVSLEQLSVSVPVDVAALSHLAMSHTLKELELVLHLDKSCLRPPCLASDIIPLRDVQVLSLKVWDLCVVTALLRRRCQRFRSLTLEYCSNPTTEAVSSFLGMLASPQRAHSLQSIRLVPDDAPSYSQRLDVSMPACLTHDALRPLTCLSRLRHLEIDLDHWFSIDDDEFLSLVCSWPLLRTLSLDWSRDVHGYAWRSVKYVTFKGLLSLLGCCPYLEGLILPLDAKVVPVSAMAVRPGGGVRNAILTHAIFPESPIHDARSVAAFLGHHLPSVTGVSAPFCASTMDDPKIQRYNKLWDEVMDHLQERESRRNSAEFMTGTSDSLRFSLLQHVSNHDRPIDRLTDDYSVRLMLWIAERKGSRAHGHLGRLSASQNLSLVIHYLDFPFSFLLDPPIQY